MYEPDPVQPLPKGAGIAPFMNFHEVLARYSRGDEVSALELLRRTWGGMLDDDATTFFEYIRPTMRSLSRCHAWGAGGTHILSAYVLGVRPLEPGFRTCEIAPFPGDLKWARGAIPTPHGILAVSWEKRNGKRWVVHAYVPKGITAHFRFPSAGGRTGKPRTFVATGPFQTPASGLVL